MFYMSVIVSLFYTTTIAAPQQTEVVEHLEISDPVTQAPEIQVEIVKPIEDNIVINHSIVVREKPPIDEEAFSVKVYKFLSDPIYKMVQTPKVNAVLRNIGTCLVNGAMDLFSFYLPPPFMPLIASAAGLVIPFEPVVMLKEKMPVTSYRRAFNTALNSFLRTFDKYKMEDEFDPYMTRRFNRRLMDDGQKET